MTGTELLISGGSFLTGAGATLAALAKWGRGHAPGRNGQSGRDGKDGKDACPIPEHVAKLDEHSRAIAVHCERFRFGEETMKRIEGKLDQIETILLERRK